MTISAWSQDVLDKQILDTDGARVVRVNDIELVRVNGDVMVSNVDIGLLGILRRIGLERLGRWARRAPSTRMCQLAPSPGISSSR